MFYVEQFVVKKYYKQKYISDIDLSRNNVDNYNMIIKSNVSDIMISNGWRFRELSKECQLSVKTLWKATKDHLIGTCSLATLQKISDCLGVRVCDLFDEVLELPAPVRDEPEQVNEIIVSYGPASQDDLEASEPPWN